MSARRSAGRRGGGARVARPPAQAEAGGARVQRAGAVRAGARACLKLVSQREHTAKQLREKLAKRGCEPEEIRGALAELQRSGFQDDRRYARIFAEDKRRLQSWGARRIRLELGRAGIARDVLDELFADDEAELDAPSELEVALELLRAASSPTWPTRR